MRIGIKRFVEKNKIRIESKMVEKNEFNPEWKDAYHYKIILRYKNKQFTSYFSKGYALAGEPTAEEVLECLILDLKGIENARNFEDWATEYGYDVDSRKAERTYNTCLKQARKFKKFLGEELCKELLNA